MHQQQHHKAPGLESVSYKLHGTLRNLKWWLFLQSSNILNPFSEVYRNLSGVRTDCVATQSKNAVCIITIHKKSSIIVIIWYCASVLIMLILIARTAGMHKHSRLSGQFQNQLLPKPQACSRHQNQAI